VPREAMGCGILPGRIGQPQARMAAVLPAQRLLLHVYDPRTVRGQGKCPDAGHAVGIFQGPGRRCGRLAHLARAESGCSVASLAPSPRTRRPPAGPRVALRQEAVRCTRILPQVLRGGGSPAVARSPHRAALRPVAPACGVRVRGAPRLDVGLKALGSTWASRRTSPPFSPQGGIPSRKGRKLVARTTPAPRTREAVR
jgi:hypothetical protein